MTALDDLADLLDWKRRIFSLYAEVRAEEGAKDAWAMWCSVRDDLFRSHPQSPIPDTKRVGFGGLPYFAYDPAWRIIGRLNPAEARQYDIPTSDESPMSFHRVAIASFEVRSGTHQLEVYWFDAYGGGLFLPFADATSGTATYGAGRYLYDTVKGADLGSSRDRLVLDFNYAYNPSCAYDPRWVCPLAPPANRLPFAVEAGEKTPDAHEAPRKRAS